MWSRLKGAVETRLLLWLWAVDGALIVLYLFLGLLTALGILEAIPDILSIGRDWAIPEAFGYLKWAAVVVLLAMTALRGGGAWALALAAAFLVILVDDAFMVHERMGPVIFGMLPERVRSVALAEAVSFGIVGAVVLVAIGTAWRLAGGADRRKIVTIIGLIVLIAVFAVLIDFIHESITLGLVGYSLWVVMEDGGEMLLTSVIVAYVVRSIWRRGTA